MLPQVRGVEETFMALLAHVWSLSTVNPEVVQVEVAQVEVLAAGGADEGVVRTVVRAVDLLVAAQGTAGTERPEARLTTEGFRSRTSRSAL